MRELKYSAHCAILEADQIKMKAEGRVFQKLRIISSKSRCHESSR